MGRRAARGVGWVLVAGLIAAIVSGVLLDGAIGVADRSFAVLDTTTSDAASQPISALRSGGTDSLVPWDSLGFQGRNFTGTGPTAEQIAAFSGAPALEPIRAYAGISSAADVEDRAALAVRDLERAGGFTGSICWSPAPPAPAGWTRRHRQPGNMTGGDIASVAIQYSYLPSWVSFIVDQTRARRAGRAMFDAVYEAWSALPADARPKLLVFGVSLGPFSGEAAFSGEFDLHNRNRRCAVRRSAQLQHPVPGVSGRT